MTFCSTASPVYRLLAARGPSADLLRWVCPQIWDSMPGYSDCSFADSLWSAMDEAICLPDCDVYSYKSDGEDDPFGMSSASHPEYRFQPACTSNPGLSVGLHN